MESIVGIVSDWLRGYPGWGSATLNIEYTDAAPGNSGLFSGGVEELDRRTNIWGDVTIRSRFTFILRRIANGQYSNDVDARWLLDFQKWVQYQSLNGLAPKMGTDTWWRAEKGKLRDASQTGTGIYTINLIAEYTNVYGGE